MQMAGARVGVGESYVEKLKHHGVYLKRINFRAYQISRFAKFFENRFFASIKFRELACITYFACTKFREFLFLIFHSWKQYTKFCDFHLF